MEVKTVTYTDLLGTFYLQGWLSSERKDSHQAEMLSEGWKIIGEVCIPGDGRTLGLGVVRTKIVTTYSKG